MSRLLFLDFDGVLHPLAPSRALHPHGWFCWLPILEELLRPWPDVDVVVHSSWRTHFSDPELRQLLEGLSNRLIGSVPPTPKAVAIESVLKANMGYYNSYIVLDDDVRLARNTTLQVILCDPVLGLSSKKTQAALSQWLEGR